MADIEPLRWADDHLALLDQRALPEQEIWLTYRSAAAVADAIRDMVVRGAPAIGIAAAYGAALEARRLAPRRNAPWPELMATALTTLAASRPTAVNLFWALDQVRATLVAAPDGGDVPARLDQLARRIHAEDVAANRRLGDFGAALIAAGSVVYTHCNTGALATGGYGTALGVIRSAWRQQRLQHVLAGETRPWWQGARLTAWELQREGIPFSLNVDSAAAHLMRERKVAWVIVGADRIAANGDTANKIGTYSLAVLARHHGARFMVAAPRSTFDLATASGAEIPIEQRPCEEVTTVRGVAMAPPACAALNPAFDVTPADLIDAIVTEHGVIMQPNRDAVAAHFALTPTLSTLSTTSPLGANA